MGNNLNKHQQMFCQAVAALGLATVGEVILAISERDYARLNEWRERIHDEQQRRRQARDRKQIAAPASPSSANQPGYHGVQILLTAATTAELQAAIADLQRRYGTQFVQNGDPVQGNRLWPELDGELWEVTGLLWVPAEEGQE